MIRFRFCSAWLLALFFSLACLGQTLVNVDFGGAATTAAHGTAAVGLGTNDYWNAYTHYPPRLMPGMPEAPNGSLAELKYSDGTPSRIAIAVTNAPGVWGNASGDPMFDSFIFAPNGSNITAAITGLEPGRYHFVLYGHADADASPEQNSVFWLSTKPSAARLGPAGTSGANGWRVGQPWLEGRQYVIFRDVSVETNEIVMIEAAPGSGGLAVLNGLQIFSKGTAPPRLGNATGPQAPAAVTNLLFKEARYEGSVSHSEARFKVSIDVESMTTNELSATLFEGDLAVLSPKLPPGWRILPSGRKYILTSGGLGAQRLELELAAKINRAEPWNELSFTGPPAAIATISAKPGEPGVELHLTAGTSMEESGDSQRGSDRPVRGVIGADGRVGLRWQNTAAEVNREAVVVADTETAVQFTPAVIRMSTAVRFDVLQGRMAEARVSIPAEQSLTKVAGEGIRDWRLDSAGPSPILIVEFLRPIEKSATITLLTEQAVAQLPSAAVVSAPQPMNIQREQGGLRLSSEDVMARVASQAGLRQVNAASGELAAFRFSGRPASVQVGLTRVEPAVTVKDRVRFRLEETRLRIWHALDLKIERAGIYSLETQVPQGYTVAEVTGEGVDDWKMADGRLRIGFAKRAIGAANVTVLLEQALAVIPPEIALGSVQIVGAEKSSATIGAAAAAGLNLKTGVIQGAREVPVSALPEHSDELLAFRADSGDWRVTLTTERPPPRLVAEVFDLITVGDGLVGGSATIRFAIVNQGVQEFRVRLPDHWKNVEFTGANIRRTDHLTNIWTVALQDKAWDAYTLVVTYDYSFDSKQSVLDAAGAHPLDVERETGSVAVTAAQGLEIRPDPVVEPFRIVDPTELAATDRSLITRPVVLAGRYEGANYTLKLNVTRNEQVAVLDAVADRAQMTSVITDRGEMLTQASFMVKNNDRQFQRFRLPPGASLWGAAVNGEPVKVDRDGDWVLVSLPRNADRDRAFAVDLNYAQQLGELDRIRGWWPKKVELLAPETDMAGTYSEWELYSPASHRLGSFGGAMIAPRGVTYGLHDAWGRFTKYYGEVWDEYAAGIVMAAVLIGFVGTLVILVRRSGFSGFVRTMVIFVVIGVLAFMLLPSLAKAKARANRITSVNNLKNIGLAMRTYAVDHNGQYPAGIDDLMPELGTPKILVHPETKAKYSYLGAGKSEEQPDAVLAFGISPNGGADVLLGDGSVQQVTADRLNEMLARAPQGGPAVLTTSTPESGENKKEKVPEASSLAPQLLKRYGLASREKLDAAKDAPSQKPASEGMLGMDAGAPAGGAGGFMAGFALGQAVPVIGNAPSGTKAGEPGQAPTVAGLRSLKIEIPKTGRYLHFTRTLGLQGKPASIQFTMMSRKAFVAMRTLFQVATFLAGLILVRVQWSRVAPSPLWLASGVALALIGAGSLFIAWQVLHLVFILIVPFGLAIGLAWAALKLYRLSPAKRPSPAVPPLPPSAASAAAAAAILALAFAPFDNGHAASSAPYTNAISVVNAEFTGQAGDHSVTLDGKVELVANGANQTVTLFGKDVGLEEFAVIQGDARLWRDGERVGVLMPAAGTATARLKLVAKVGGDVSRRTLDFGLPPALGSRVKLTLNEPDAEVEFPSALSLNRTTNGTVTQLEAILGSAARLNMSWSPRLKRAAEGAAIVFAQQSSLITAGGGVVSTKTKFDFTAPQGELRSVRIQLPAGQRLLRVDGDAVRTWDAVGAGRDVVAIEFSKPLSSASVTVETEKNLDALPANVLAEAPKPLDVKRATGAVAIRATEELGLSPDRLDGLERIETSDFEKSFGKDASGASEAWRFLRPDFTLTLKAETLTPKIEAALRNDFIIGTEQVRIQTRVNYKISRVGVFTLRLAVPAGLQIENVASEAMSSWDDQPNTGGRVVELTLKSKTLGAVDVDLRLARAVTNITPQLALAGVHPLNVDKLTGFISAAAEPGITLKTGALAGLTEIPVSELGGGSPGAMPSLAYKYLQFQPAAAAPWNLSVGVESMDSWVRAETASSATIGETLVSGHTVVRYDIQNAPLKDFSLRVPLDWRNVEIQGGAIRRRDRTTNANSAIWHVELQSKVRGEFQLEINWEAARTTTNRFVLLGVEALGAERESGWIALQTRGQIQLTSQATNDALIRSDAAELPAWRPDSAGNGGSPALVFHYLRPGWTLPLDVDRYASAGVLQALADQTELKTVVAGDGQWMTRIAIKIRNNGRQHLEMTLPKGASVWSAFIDGQPVRPSQSGGRLLLPLEGTQDRDAPVSIQMTYVGVGAFPANGGTFGLESPRMDIPMKDARWEVYLPADYTYAKFGGSMTYEGADTVPVAEDFTVGAYNRQEAEQAAAASSAVADTFAKVRRGLQSGSFGEASQLSFYRNSRDAKEGDASREAESLAGELHKAQGSNLMEAQRSYMNNNPYGASRAAGAWRGESRARSDAYDAEVALKQADKLEKAQAVAVARVTPLRVNLPVSGVRHLFTQVLQTEVDRPLTVTFHATNDRQTTWFGSTARAIAGFAALWLGSIVALSFRARA